MTRHRGDGRPFKRGRVWWIAYYVDGKEVRESSGSADRRVAQRLLHERLGSLARGTYVARERERVSLAELLDAVVTYYDLREHRSARTVRGHVERLKTEFRADHVRALDVTTQRVQRVVQTWRTAGATPATCNRRLAILRRAYRLGKVRLDPAKLDFTDLFLPENSPRGRYFDAAAFASLHAALPPYLQDFVEFAYITGVRKQQLARTTWAHLLVRDDAWLLTWQPAEVKARQPHVLALAGRPLAIIQARHAARDQLFCPFVFHGRACGPGHQPSKEYGCVGDFKKAWATACHRAGLPVGRAAGGYVFHNTRHTAVTNLVNAGVPAHEAMNVSGHRTRSVFDRYSIGLEQQVQRALEKATAYTEQLRAEAPRRVIALPRGH